MDRGPTLPGSALDRLADKLAHLPAEPGVYLMRDARGAIFYVGKAGNLRQRVRSYFHHGGDERAFVQLLDQMLADIEIAVVSSEHEALLLENQLIKQHRPRFNVRLRDDKNYLSLRLDDTGYAAADRGQAVKRHRLFPRLEVTRRRQRDGARYFGPYTSALAVRETLRLVNHHFGLRTCSDRTLLHRKRPCIMHQMGRCSAPCCRSVAVDEYRARIADVVLLLGGRQVELCALLRQRMQQASAAQAYEAAARLRDQVRAVEKVMQAQPTPSGKLVDRDLIGYARSGPLLCAVLVPQRNGLLGAPRLHRFDDLVAPDDEVLSSLLVQLYQAAADTELPDQVLLPLALPDAAGLAHWLSGRRRRRRVSVRAPRRGPAHRLLEVAQRNAQNALAEAQRSRETRQQESQRLQRLLRLEQPPRCIECFDVSTLQGQAAVASKVRFVDGAAERSGYRRYLIKNVVGQDDFAMLYEVLTRRLRRGLREGDLPDLLLVDGGPGQLAVAAAACRDLGVRGLPIAGIAKSRVIDDGAYRGEAPVRSPERLYLAGRKNPIALLPHSAERALIERIRDEAHRFAIAFHRQRRNRRSLHSALAEIPGVGPRLSRRLLRQFGSVRALRQADVARLQQVGGVSARLAQTILCHLAADAPLAARPG
ncbi:MAG: excinuclease ABC subunit UvrC [Deltaproteobacteria bacterium]|nr:excinuclease ABC subunit UvrC [Deltaproteobacteria bacterium]